MTSVFPLVFRKRNQRCTNVKFISIPHFQTLHKVREIYMVLLTDLTLNWYVLIMPYRLLYLQFVCVRVYC